MIKITDNDLFRGGEKIGYIEGNHIFEHTGKKIGYFSESEKKVYDMTGKEVCRITGNHIILPGSDHFIRVEDNRSVITGGVYSDIVLAGIRMLLGE